MEEKNMNIPVLLALGAASALTLSACGSGTSSTSVASDAGASGGVASQVSGQALHVASTSLGKVLVDASGKTVYTLSADGPNKSTCDASCISFWPAVAPGKAAHMTAKIGSTTTPDGTKIATVAGHPVYTFIKDQGPGDVNGEGVEEFGGTWYALSPAGTTVMSASTPSSATSSSPAGGYVRGGY
jgi:predicted lipoprotein with Yx(FWY)xxD motif